MHAAGDSTEAQLRVLWEMVRSQQQELAYLRARLSVPVPNGDAGPLERLPIENKSDSPTTAFPSTGDVSPDPAVRAMRRSLLKTAGVSAAAIVGTGLLGMRENMTGSTPKAEAADGSQLIIGQANTGSSTTLLSPVAGAGPDILLNINNQASTSTATTAAAVQAAGPSGTNGLVGISNGAAGYGVQGESDQGYGVVGSSGSGIDFYASGTGRLQQRLQGFTGAPTTGAYATGEQIRDAVGDLYICVSHGTPGTWRKVASLLSGYTGGAVHFLSSPLRLLDTRPGQPAGITPGQPLPANQTSTFQVTGTSYNGLSVPAGAMGIIGTLTVTGQAGGINVRVFPSDASVPLASSITAFPATPFLANCVLSRLSPSGQVSMWVDNFPVNVIFDLTAFIA